MSHSTTRSGKLDDILRQIEALEHPYTDGHIMLDVLGIHDRLASTDNDATVEPSVSVWHLLVSVVDFCRTEGIDLDKELADARDFVRTR